MRIDIFGLKDSYYPVEVDEGNPGYFGFMDSVGNWYIMKLTSYEGGEKSIRYARGSKFDDFQTAWNNRASLVYDYPTIF